jgi:hypothetical protein
MPLELAMGAEQIPDEDVIHIFELFREAYEIKPEEGILTWMRRGGVDHLKKFGLMEYKPCPGAKFIGESKDNTTRFYGHRSQDDPEWEKRDSVFQELCLAYFKNKP